MRDKLLTLCNRRFSSAREPFSSACRDPGQLWEHYVMLGQFEGRPFRFTCENKIER